MEGVEVYLTSLLRFVPLFLFPCLISSFGAELLIVPPCSSTTQETITPNL